MKTNSIRTALLRAFTGCAAVFLVFAAASGPARADTVNASDDAYVDLAARGANFGKNPNLLVRRARGKGRGGDRAAFLKFDLSALPDDLLPDEVAKATLRLWVQQVRKPGTLVVEQVLDDWDETDITGRNAPDSEAAVPEVAVELGFADAGRFLTVDVTDVVLAWLADPAADHGLALVSDGAEAWFDSKENPQTGHAPELEVALVAVSTAGVDSITAGPGLTGDATTGDVTLEVDFPNLVTPGGIRIESTGSNVRIVASGSTITIDPAGGITIEGDGDVAVSATGGDLALSGDNVTISAVNDVTVQGTTVGIDSTIKTTVDSAITTEIDGGFTTTVHGGAQVNVTGGIVTLN